MYSFFSYQNALIIIVKIKKIHFFSCHFNIFYRFPIRINQLNQSIKIAGSTYGSGSSPIEITGSGSASLFKTLQSLQHLLQAKLFLCNSFLHKYANFTPHYLNIIWTKTFTSFFKSSDDFSKLRTIFFISY